MDEPFFSPTSDEIKASTMTQFQQFCEQETGETWSDDAAFYRFSVASYRDFWSLFLSWSKLHTAGKPTPVCQGDSCEHAIFFPNLTLNYTESLLYPSVEVAPETPAVIAINEQGQREAISWRDLRERVTRVASGLASLGLQPGDRVIAVARNNLDSIVAALAATGLGAVWSSVAPDLGIDAVLSRFSQLEPTMLVAHQEYSYQGRTYDLQEDLSTLVQRLPSLRQFVCLNGDSSICNFEGLPAISLQSLKTTVPVQDFSWPMLLFNHPLFVLFSSGTTGKPKAIVHGAGGTLLEHLKEHRLHSNFGPTDKLLFHTSCGWMMWNWQLSALASGTTLVVYDGSPTHPNKDSMWDIIRDEKITVFGTSPTYLQYCRDAGISPAKQGSLEALRAIQSTGSVLAESHFDWVKAHIKPIQLQSISGGTDIVGCFVLGHPNLPVYRGESQCISLAMDVRAYDMDTHTEVPPGQMGELVCTNPFPSRPIYFLQDRSGQRFHEAYFQQHEGVWTHGDFLILYERGSARILGRSDGILNIRGVRIGPAEIYRVLEGFPTISKAMAVEQKDPRSPGGTRMVLLLVTQTDQELEKHDIWAIKKKIKQALSPVHVPAVIAQVSALPTTFSGKLSTRATRDAVNGNPIINAGAMQNPECLQEIQQHPALQHPPHKSS